MKTKRDEHQTAHTCGGCGATRLIMTAVDYDEEPDCTDPLDPDYKRTVDGDDIAIASWEIATLLFGPDNRSINRDDIECQIQEVIKTSFDRTMAVTS